MKEFELKLEREGGNFVNVLKQEKDNSFSIYWSIALENSNPIVLMDFIDEQRFLIADWTAHIWVFDHEKKEQVYENKFSDKITGKAVLSEDKSKLYICYSQSDAHVAILNLKGFSIERDLAYPDMGYVYHFERYKDKLMLYSCTKRGGWSHHYEIVDIASGEYSVQKLPFTQFDDSDRKRPLLDEKNEKLIMPYWGDLEQRKNSKGELVFVYRMMVLDMKSYEVEKIIPVREFPIHQLRDEEEDSEELAEKLISPENDENFQDSFRTFMLNMNSLILDADGKSFWICWRGGIVRRFDYDGNLSPMYATKSIPDYMGDEAFDHGYFHSQLERLAVEGLIIREGSEEWWMPITKMDRMDAKMDEFEAIDLVELPEVSQAIVVKTEEDEQAEAERIYNVVNLENVDNHPSVLAALDYMIESDWKQVGHYLAFLFKDKDNKLISEKEFFKQIWEIEGALERMEKIARKALDYGVSNRWGGDNDQTALFNLFIHLCKSDSKYAKIGLQFVDDMDRDHDGWCCNDMIEAVRSAMGKKAFDKELKNWEDIADYMEYHEL